MTLNPFSTVHHLYSRVHSTFRHHTRGPGSFRRQRAVRIWSQHYHKSHFLPFFGCIESTTLQPYGFKALVPAGFRVVPTPALTRLTPRYDARIEVTDGGPNPNNIDIQITPSHHPLRPPVTFAILCRTSGSTTFNLECSWLSRTVYDMGLTVQCQYKSSLVELLSLHSSPLSPASHVPLLP